jgi:hypothetical protein
MGEALEATDADFCGASEIVVTRIIGELYRRDAEQRE